MYENMEMRKVLSTELAKLMEKDERIVILDADLARVFANDALHKKFPQRGINVGIAEANMASVAAGLAAYGFVPFISTFTPFATRRICDQVAISISYAKRNVKILGFDPGIVATFNGGTHMSMEDIGVLRSIPGMVIFEPADAMQLSKALPVLIAYDGPVYVRMLRKSAPPKIFEEDYQFDLFKADVLKEGKDVTLFASGIEVIKSLQAAEQLKEKGVSAEVVSVHTIKPIDKNTVIASARKTGCAVACENHNVLGGLGSAVAETLAESCPVPMRFIGVQDHFGEVGKESYLSTKYHMNTEDIVAKALEVIAVK